MSADGLTLVMPMAGRGSRFARRGMLEPKPLIMLGGRPFFAWAVESVRRVAPVRRMIFVVLEEHCRAHRIDRRIAELYPAAQVVAIPEVTAGAAETARIGVQAADGEGPLAVNDCDHAFLALGMADTLARFAAGSAEMALLCFRSANPAYSYAVLGPDGEPCGTVEKVVASPYAIAGCYLFGAAALFLRQYEAYAADCPYDEMFVSGLFNHGAAQGARIARLDAERHWSFGTPDELDATDPATLEVAFA